MKKETPDAEKIAYVQTLIAAFQAVVERHARNFTAFERRQRVRQLSGAAVFMRWDAKTYGGLFKPLHVFKHPCGSICAMQVSSARLVFVVELDRVILPWTPGVSRPRSNILLLFW